MTYQAKVYEKQGGAELVVASSGVITVESGGDVNVESGGALALESGGVLSVASGGQISMPVTTTDSTTISNYGLSHVAGNTTGVGAKTYALSAPDRAGLYKSIICTTANVSDLVTIDVGPATLVGLGTQDLIKMTTSGDTVSLISSSTSTWTIVARTPTTVTTTS